MLRYLRDYGTFMELRGEEEGRADEEAGSQAMNIGLLFVPVSVYQMLRGALVLFVGLFSVIFLGRRLTRAQWMALATVMLGVAVVGFSSVGGAKKEIESFAAATGGEEADPLLGVCLILVAQILCVRFCGGNRKDSSLLSHAARRLSLFSRRRSWRCTRWSLSCVSPSSFRGKSSTDVPAACGRLRGRLWSFDDPRRASDPLRPVWTHCGGPGRVL